MMHVCKYSIIIIHINCFHSDIAEVYASRNKMACFEISPLCDFNIRESFCELARMALHRNGMERIWRTNKGEIML